MSKGKTKGKRRVVQNDQEEAARKGKAGDKRKRFGGRFLYHYRVFTSALDLIENADLDSGGP